MVFALDEARLCMTLAGMSYASENQPAGVRDALAALLADPRYATAGAWDLVWLALGPPPGADHLVYVVKERGPRSRYAIAIRGTVWRMLQDAWEDFDVFGTVAWPTAQPPDPRIRVAPGSWEGLQLLLGMRTPAVGAGAEAVSLGEFLARVARQDGGLDLLVTGHSLGGALATLLTAWLVEAASGWGLAPKAVNVTSYTFAAPTVGNAAFAAYFEGQRSNPRVGLQAHRVFNARDVVPFGFANLGGVLDCGIPLTLKAELELIACITPIQAALAAREVSYVHVGDVTAGTAVSLPNGADPPGAPNPAPDLQGVNFWVGHEHGWNTYLRLLGAPEMPFSSGATE